MPPMSDMNDDCVSPAKNVVFAINYKVPLVDEFVASERKRRVTDAVENTTGVPSTMVQTPMTRRRTPSNVENSIPKMNACHGKPSLIQLKATTTTTTPPTSSTTRRSQRDKGKRELNLARTRVRYDMQLVPPVPRNKDFLQSYNAWWLSTSHLPRRSSRLEDTNYPAFCRACSWDATPHLLPESVVWIPSKRSEWEDAVSEMTAVCTSAARRRHDLESDNVNKPFQPPLSRDYIRDRVDIDDPLLGYQMRHAKGGWLQGFVLWTNFTTWTHYFRWDSLHDSAGMKKLPDVVEGDRYWDLNGSLSAELQALSRSGDPLVGGIVFPEIAEIALLGGLGCGEYLLRMALEGIRAKGNYKYVVLQATDSSKSFYERFGFVRIGAVCRYTERDDSPLVGYRHWTHANESSTSLQMHGGPSYMMCLKLPVAGSENDSCRSCGRPPSEMKRLSYMDAMLAHQIDAKPTIKPLGGPSTPFASKCSKRMTPLTGNVLFQTSSSKKAGRRALGSVIKHKNSPMSTGILNWTAKRPHNLVNEEGLEPPMKRIKSNEAFQKLPLERLLSPVFEAPTRQQEKCHSAGPTAPPNCALNVPRSPLIRRASREESDVEVAPVIDDIASKTLTATSAKFQLPGATHVRVATNLTPTFPDESSPASKCLPRTVSVDIPKYAPPTVPSADGIVHPVDKKFLVKQKVKAYPRNRTHFYNRVVKKKHDDCEYFFVLYYAENEETLIVVPLAAKGLLTGKREGRPRYQALVKESDETFCKVFAADYEVVPSSMIMKTPIVALEAWDVIDE